MEKIALNKRIPWIVILLNLAGIFLWRNYNYHWLKIVRYALLTAFLVPLGAIDWKKKIIPNKILLAMTGIRALLLVGDLFVYPAYRAELAISAFGGMAVGFLVFLLAYFLSRRSIGLGDVKMIAVIGFYLGISQIWSTMVVGLLLAGIFSCIQLARKKVTMKESIPLAPFLSAGAILVMLLGM